MVIDVDGLALLLIMTLAVFGLGWCAGVWCCCAEDRRKLKEENVELKEIIKDKRNEFNKKEDTL